jgi:hypothetical protein
MGLEAGGAWHARLRGRSLPRFAAMEECGSVCTQGGCTSRASLLAKAAPAHSFLLSLGRSKHDAPPSPPPPPPRLSLSSSPSHLGQVGDAQHEDDGVQDVGLARPVETLHQDEKVTGGVRAGGKRAGVVCRACAWRAPPPTARPLPLSLLSRTVMALKYRSNSGTTTRWAYDLKPSMVTSLMYMVAGGGAVRGAGGRRGERKKSVHDASTGASFRLRLLSLSGGVAAGKLLTRRGGEEARVPSGSAGVSNACVRVRARCVVAPDEVSESEASESESESARHLSHFHECSNPRPSFLPPRNAATPGPTTRTPTKTKASQM